MTDDETLYYHGSNRLFKSFSLDHAGKGTGVKFGYGIYLTSRYKTAAHYAKPRKADDVTDYYVYTVAIPQLTTSNCLSLNPNVSPSQALTEKVSDYLEEALPQEAIVCAKSLRKYVGNLLLLKSGNPSDKSSRRFSLRQMTCKASPEAEKAASAFFLKLGIYYYEWPVDWKHPDKGTNIAVLNPEMIRIIKVESVELDKNYQLIEGTQHEIEIL